MNPWYRRAVKTEERKRLSRRLVTVGIFFSLLLSTVGAKAVYLQVIRGPWLSQAAAKQYERSIRTQPKRGTIYDTKHRELAASIDIMSIAAFPEKIADVHSTTKAISPLLDVDGGRLFRQLLSGRKFVWVKRQVSPRSVESVKGLALGGISFIAERSRFYPNRSLAAQALGFTGVDGNGLEGIEYHYDRYLKGSAGRLTVLEDALGRRFEPEALGNADTHGYDLVLTIDRTVQYIAERALEAGVTKYSARSGMAVVMVPKTGAVLALVNYPYFNPNAFGEYDRSAWRNRVVTDQFEPGSTLKIFTAAAALASGLFEPDTLIFAENGEYRIGDDVVHDTHPSTWLSLTQVVKYSSNIGAAKISERIGPESLHSTLTRFGFSERTGIDFPGETPGTLLPHRRWSRMDASAIAFGQGISVSAIQLTRATGAIANDGALMRPYIVQAVLDPSGGLVKRFGPEKIRQAIPLESARAVGRMMRAVLDEDGTGIHAVLDGYSACGKTGTAQKVDGKKGYAEDKYVASFVGFAPAERPEIVVLVLIDEPKKTHHGGVVAAPVFRKIALETLDYLSIPPKRERKHLTVSLEPGSSG